MEMNNEAVDLLFERSKLFVTGHVELYKLKSVEKVSNLMSSMVYGLVLMIVFSIVFIMANIGLSIYLGTILFNPYLGFFIVAGFYIFLGLVIMIFRNIWIKKPIKNSIINHMLN